MECCGRSCARPRTCSPPAIWRWSGPAPRPPASGSSSTPSRITIAAGAAWSSVATARRRGSFIRRRKLRRNCYSKPIGKHELYQAGNPVGIKSLVADLVLSILLAGILAPVGTSAVEVGESILAGEAPGTEDAPALLLHLRICRQRHHRAAYVERRF